MAGHANGAEGLWPEFREHADGVAGGKTAGAERVSVGRLQTPAWQLAGHSRPRSPGWFPSAPPSPVRPAPAVVISPRWVTGYCALWPMRTPGRGHVPQRGSGTSGLARASVSPSGSHFCCLCSSQEWEAFNK